VINSGKIYHGDVSDSGVVKRRIYNNAIILHFSKLRDTRHALNGGIQDIILTHHLNDMYIASPSLRLVARSSHCGNLSGKSHALNM
jgi:hypothetical protein